MTRQASPVDGGPAFPRIDRLEPRGMAGFDVVATGGMTLREKFADSALQGILGNPYWIERGPFTAADVARAAWEYADAMLAARGGA